MRLHARQEQSQTKPNAGTIMQNKANFAPKGWPRRLLIKPMLPVSEQKQVNRACSIADASQIFGLSMRF
jgi:hypothetical protein